MSGFLGGFEGLGMRSIQYPIQPFFSIERTEVAAQLPKVKTKYVHWEMEP